MVRLFLVFRIIVVNLPLFNIVGDDPLVGTRQQVNKIAKSHNQQIYIKSTASEEGIPTD
jgi:hypothetical protein